MINLMIVDDNSAMRKVIRSIVAELTEQIHECADGSEALATYERIRPDCVLMDIKMKQLDGITATREIRTSFPDARIIILTTYDDPDYRTAAQAAGAHDYLTKENLLELKQLLTALNGEAATRELLSPTPE